MKNDMNAWIPALYLKKEADKRDLDSNELNPTIAMTMLLKGSPTMNMFLADSGLKRVEAETELSKSRTELNRVRADLNIFNDSLVAFQEYLTADEPKVGDFITGIIEFIMHEDEMLDEFKAKVLDLINDDDENFLDQEVNKVKKWFGLPLEDG